MISKRRAVGHWMVPIKHYQENGMRHIGRKETKGGWSTLCMTSQKAATLEQILSADFAEKNRLAESLYQQRIFTLKIHL